MIWMCECSSYECKLSINISEKLASRLFSEGMEGRVYLISDECKTKKEGKVVAIGKDYKLYQIDDTTC